MSPKDTKDDPLDKSLLENGIKVLRTEADAINALADSLDENFASAVRAILNTGGRVIVSGMGKSGHIARKIAATFASTGTPALFVHPGEASHGDLGMIARNDVVLLLSNSGETSELADIIGYTRRHDITLIGVASKAISTLLVKSDISILLPPAAEACPNGLAPTTSTTMTLALGDAMAVALMKERKFSPENYRDFHPGGKLGALLSTVDDLMHTGDALPLLARDTKMTEGIFTISSKGFGVAGVINDDGVLIGIVTDGDLRRNMEKLLEHTAGDIMTENPFTVAPGSMASKAVSIMNKRKITTLFVVPESGKPDGILHIHDCLRAGVV